MLKIVGPHMTTVDAALTLRLKRPSLVSIAHMTYEDYKQSIETDGEPPPGLSLALQALWWDARGNWEQAHTLAQTKEDAEGNWVHAYLHRKEGDVGNAGYWYRRANKPPQAGGHDIEWEQLVRALLG